MKTAKKYSSFEELKFNEGKTTDEKTTIKRHTEFERFIRAVSTIKFRKKTTPGSK